MRLGKAYPTQHIMIEHAKIKSHCWFIFVDTGADVSET